MREVTMNRTITERVKFISHRNVMLIAGYESLTWFVPLFSVSGNTAKRRHTPNVG